jgi:hypothetical protein
MNCDVFLPYFLPFCFSTFFPFLFFLPSTFISSFCFNSVVSLSSSLFLLFFLLPFIPFLLLNYQFFLSTSFFIRSVSTFIHLQLLKKVAGIILMRFKKWDSLIWDTHQRRRITVLLEPTKSIAARPVSFEPRISTLQKENNNLLGCSYLMTVRFFAHHIHQIICFSCSKTFHMANYTCMREKRHILHIKLSEFLHASCKWRKLLMFLAVTSLLVFILFPYV